MKLFEKYDENYIEKIIISHLIDYINFENNLEIDFEKFLIDYFKTTKKEIEDFEEFKQLCLYFFDSWSENNLF